MRILVTGAAGFIGFHAVKALIKRGDDIVALDSINSYYDVDLKFSRLGILGFKRDSIEWKKQRVSSEFENLAFIRADICDRENLWKLFESERFDVVCNLAAQPGVRYSIENPYAYIESNINGFINILECCRHFEAESLVYASSSSVYGLNKSVPFSVSDNVDHPVSLYAATKKANELMAHSYSHLYGLPTTGLRFFTVYGPWGRPDMAPILFARAISEGKPINVFNNGMMSRDFTYIDDIAEGLVRVIDRTPVPNPSWDGKRPDPSSSQAPYRVYNIGNNNSVNLMDFIGLIELELGKTAEKIMLPLQPGDVIETCADVSALERDVGYRPSTSVEYGVKKFVEWFKEYYSQV
jgi:UDP-glucuronate 4-epimerase